MRNNLFITGCLLVMLAACQSPFLLLPGTSLKGAERQTHSFAFANQFKLLQLETRPEKPYSVYLRVTVINGGLYIDAAKKRRWHEHLKSNNQIRIKLGDGIYRAMAHLVKTPEIVEQFLPGRFIYRLDPVRTPVSLPVTSPVQTSP